MIQLYPLLEDPANFTKLWLEGSALRFLFLPEIPTNTACDRPLKRSLTNVSNLPIDYSV